MLGRLAVTVVVAVALGVLAVVGSFDSASAPLDAAARGRPAASTSAAEPAPAATRTITYDVAGIDHLSNLEQFADQVAETYADARGWSLGGSVRFVRVPSGGTFTIWLAAGRRVPRFGDPCDSTYSCQQGRDVIINEARWLFGSPAWNASGATLRDYRHMVVNHETGHWLGFRHSDCSAPGAPAAVMQQQSISLQGCAPSAWPSAGERQWAAVTLGDAAYGRPIGAIEGTTRARRTVRVRGWAWDPDTLGPTIVMVRVDGTGSGHPAALVRPDIADRHPGAGPAHGFSVRVPVSAGPHRVCVDALNVTGPGSSVPLGCRDVSAAGARPGSSRPS
jgi:hypothetical protein